MIMKYNVIEVRNFKGINTFMPTASFECMSRADVKEECEAVSKESNGGDDIDPDLYFMVMDNQLSRPIAYASPDLNKLHWSNSHWQLG